MRLLFLEDSLKEEFGIDAILLIDTEGLGAPEKMNDKDCKKKDRQLAAFAMSVSDLTLINVLGETLNDLTEILQIVIVTMARLDKIDMTPDILMVQHLKERDSSRTKGGSGEFCKAIQEAIKLTEEKDMECGVRNCKSLKKLLDRVQNGTLLKQFRPYKHGATANAPPSKEYHEDVVNLYETILTVLKGTKQSKQQIKKFCTWHDIMPSFWDAISEQNWILEFKNIRDIQEFVERSNKIDKVKQAISNAFDNHSDDHETKFRIKIKNLQDTEKTEDWNKEKEILMGNVELDLKSVPHGCSKMDNKACKECEKALNLQRELFRDVEGKACEQDTKLTISSFIAKQRESLKTRLEQQANATKIRFGTFEELDNIIQKFLKKSQGGYSEEKVDQVLEEVKREVSSMLKVSSAGRRILEEIKAVYQNDLAVIEAVSTRVNGNIYNVKNLRSIDAISLSKMERAVHFAGMTNYSKTLDVGQESLLFGHLNKIPGKLLKARRSEIYLDGMIADVKSSLDKTISKFQEMNFPNKKFLSEFKWQVHIHGLKIFHEDMKKREATWKETNDPMHILNANMSTYREQIETILKNGYSSETEGELICNTLYAAIKNKSQKAADSFHISKLQGKAWLTNADRVRLKYFKELAKKVQSGSKEKALQHFFEPSSAIRSWFRDKIDSYLTEDAENEFDVTMKTEYEKVTQSVSNAQNFEGLKIYVDKYLSEADVVQYKPKMEINQINFTSCKDSLLMKMETQRNKKQKEIVINLASKSQKMLDVLGCVEHCPICGSICWGSHGHENDTGDTKKHHTCHQPTGLNGCHYSATKKLANSSCEQQTDSNIWREGGEATGVKWSEYIRRPKHSNWLYGAHQKRQFNDLMKWFFVNLHEDLAKAWGIQPADISNFGGLNLDAIILTMNSAINQ